jgi:peptidoglycan LD-endopeptidase CwlK
MAIKIHGQSYVDLTVKDVALICRCPFAQTEGGLALDIALPEARMLTRLAFLMSGLIGILAWIGWRFFVAPMRATSSRHAFEGEASRDGERACQSAAGRRVRSIWLGPMRPIHWQVFAPMIAVVSMIAVVLALTERISLDPLQAFRSAQGEHIQSALNPEKLVVPPTLPPSMFINTERPDLETADRDWRRLDPVFMRIALLVFARMEARGYPVALLEGYRSPERQDKLAASGTRVTNARAFQSKHQYGLAADIAPVRDGHLVVSERDSWAMQAYQALGEEAERAGLVWGGRWSLKDYGHIESPAPIGADSGK